MVGLVISITIAIVAILFILGRGREIVTFEQGQSAPPTQVPDSPSFESLLRYRELLTTPPANQDAMLEVLERIAGQLEIIVRTQHPGQALATEMVLPCQGGTGVV